MAKAVKKITYFDNNSTTLICQKAIDATLKYIRSYNPSSDSKVAKPAKSLLETSQDYILGHCGVSSATHTVIFTSGGTESNCLIIKACVKAYAKKLNEKGSNLKPHIITSALEHHSIMECVKDLVESKIIEADYVMPRKYGNIVAADVKEFIRPNTCLISIMLANNEIPVINNISEICKIAHEKNIPVHSDCVQMFGKFVIDMSKDNLDAISASAHKFYGPKGVGLLIINNQLIEGYELSAEIYGSQQHELRGGTENVSGIAAMTEAIKYTFIDRKKKNQNLFKLRDTLLTKLNEKFIFGNYDNYITDENAQKREILELVSLGPPADKLAHVLPNTILLSVVKNKGKPFCNIELKHMLDNKNFVVSVGSACLTDSKFASHVLSAIKAPSVIKRGVIRISFGDSNTLAEVNSFVKVLTECILKQCGDIELPKRG